MINKAVKNKKLWLMAVVVAVAVLIIAIPQPAHAAWSLIDIAFSSLAKIIAFVANIVFTILGLVLRLAAGLYDEVLGSTDLQKFVTAPIVQTGWTICRDIANMFFALILIIVAFATILRITEYGYKAVLPRIIIAALLINFSLVIGGVIIDFTQVLTKYFFDKLKGNTSVSTQITAALNPQVLLKEPAGIQEIEKNMPANSQPTAPDSSGQCPSGTTKLDPYGCLMGSPSNQQDCKVCYTQSQIAANDASQANTTEGGTDQFLLSAANLLFGCALIIVAIFVFFAGAILLIFRVIYLWFLLILAPLAWLAYIIPSQRSLYTKWWSTFFNQAFFAPAYGLFLFIAVSTLIKSGRSVSFASATTFNVGFVFNYIIVIGLLIAALYAAKQMGAYGADTFYKFAKDQSNKAKDWGKRQAKRPAQYAWAEGAGRGVSLVGRGLGKLPIAGGTGRRLEAKGKQMRLAPAEQPQHKAYRNLTAAMSNESLMAETQSAIGIRKLIAAQEAKKRGLVRDVTSSQAKSMIDTYNSFGMAEQVRELEELRPETIVDEMQRENAIERAKSNGNINRWGKNVFQGTEGQEIVKSLKKQLSKGEFIATYKGWTKQARTAAETAMEASFSTNFDTNTEMGQLNMDMRERFALASGKVAKAYGDATGRLIPQLADKARNHIERMNPLQIAQLDDDKDFVFAAPLLTEAQIASIRGELSGHQKKLIADNVTDSDIKEYMRHSDAWRVTQRRQQGGPAPFTTA